MSTKTDSVPDSAELIEKAFSLFPGTTDFNGLYIALHLGLKPSCWLLDPDSEFHAAKERLLEMDPAQLSPGEPEWRRDILWSWYSDVFEHLLWLDRAMPDGERSALAHQYTEEIRGIRWFQDPAEHDEQSNLARGWAFIVNDEIDQIDHWLGSFRFAEHVSRAHEMADIYKRNRATAPVIMSLSAAKAVAEFS